MPFAFMAAVQGWKESDLVTIMLMQQFVTDCCPHDNIFHLRHPARPSTAPARPRDRGKLSQARFPRSPNPGSTGLASYWSAACDSTYLLSKPVLGLDLVEMNGWVDGFDYLLV